MQFREKISIELDAELGGTAFRFASALSRNAPLLGRCNVKLGENP